MPDPLAALLAEIADCRICAAHLPHQPRPVVRASAGARILIAGQAPGRKVHESGVPWDDASGDRLRQWLGVDKDVFYDSRHIALVPMGFCYPGSAASGDLPPRPECMQHWHGRLLPQLGQLRLRIIIGQYALRYHLPDLAGRPLTGIVTGWRDLPAGTFVLPHPSPRNQGWFKRHPWFEQDLIPVLQDQVRQATLAIR